MRKPASLELGFIPVWDHRVHITQIPYQTATHIPLHTSSRKSVSYRFLNRNVNPKPMPYIIHIKLYKVYKIIADWMPVNH